MALKAASLDASCMLNYYYFKFQHAQNNFNNQWNQAFNSKNVEQVKLMLKGYYDYLVHIENEILNNESIKNEFYGPLRPGEEAIFTHIKESFDRMNSTATSEINKGIENVLNLKSSLNLTGSFKDEINTNFKSVDFKYSGLFWAQIVLILFAFGFAVYFAIHVNYENPNFWQIITIKLLVAIPLLAIWGFLNSEFRITRIEYLKIKHMQSLVNGGATAVPQMVNESNEAKLDALSKIANSFVDLEHTLNAVNRNQNKNSNVDLNKVLDIAEKVIGKRG